MLPWSRDARAVLAILCLSAAVCGPGKDTTATGTGSDAASGTGSDAGTDGPPVTTGAPAVGCVGADATACAAATPLNEENACQWVRVYRATLAGQVCEATLARSTCIEATTSEGGPGCSGFFQMGETGVELIDDTGCGSPVSEPGWEFCSIDGTTPAVPECACIGADYCSDQPDEAACAKASNGLRTCAWQAGGCAPA